MKKFKFNTWIVETRKKNYSHLLLSMGMVAALVYNLFNYLQNNKVDFIEWVIDLFNMFSSSGLVYGAFFIAFLLMALPGIYQFFRKQVVRRGYLDFDEVNLVIVDGRERFEIPQEQLSKMEFELKPLPEKKKKQPADEVKGGNFMILPMDDGNHRYEISLETPEDRQELLDMVEFMKIQHDIKVKIKQLK